jgi:hypothetical protein
MDAANTDWGKKFQQEGQRRISAALAPPQATASPYKVVNRDNPDFSHGSMGDVRGLIVHHTGGRGTVGGLESTFHQRNVSSHFSVDRDGTIYQHVPPGEVAQHMRPGWGAKGEGRSNRNMLGVEVMASADGDVTSRQRESVAQLNAAMAKEHGYDPTADVFGHGEVNPGHKEADEGMSSVGRIRSGELTGGVGKPDASGFANLAQVKSPTDRVSTAALIPPAPVDQRGFAQYAGVSKQQPAAMAPPMQLANASPNPLQGSRYDDGSSAGVFPANGVSPPGLQPPAMVASAVPSAGTAPPSPQLGGAQPVQSAALAPPTLNATPAPMLKPSPYSNTLASSEAPLQTAALKPPEFGGAIASNAPGNAVTSDIGVSKKLQEVKPGTTGATEVAAGLPQPLPKQNLGGTPQQGPIASNVTNAPNNLGEGRTVQAPTPDAAPAPAGVAPPTKVASAPETATPNQVDVKTQPNIVSPEPSQVQSEKASSKMALGGPNPKPETESVKPLQGLVSELFGVAPTNQPLQAVGQKIMSGMKPGGAGNNAPGSAGASQFPQWNLHPANPGISWGSGGFSGFGGG